MWWPSIETDAPIDLDHDPSAGTMASHVAPFSVRRASFANVDGEGPRRLAARVGEHDGVAVDRDRRRNTRDDALFLHFEHVGEVGFDRKLEPHIRRFPSDVAQLDVLAHAAADPAAAEHHQRRVGLTRARPVPQHHCAGERFGQRGSTTFPGGAR